MAACRIYLLRSHPAVVLRLMIRCTFSDSDVCAESDVAAHAMSVTPAAIRRAYYLIAAVGVDVGM